MKILIKTGREIEACVCVCVCVRVIAKDDAYIPSVPHVPDLSTVSLSLYRH